MPARRGDTRVRSPGITIVGTLLILALTVLAFAGGRLFGRVTESPAAREEVADVPAVFSPDPPPTPTTEALTPRPLPATFARPPIICLDPGHGGPDRGFIRYAPDSRPLLEEEPLVLAQAWALKSRLEQYSYRVVMTRKTDTAVNSVGADVNGDGRTAAHDPPRSDRNETIDELQTRINICNDAGADLLMSMHLNGYSTATPRGYETWFTRERPFGERNAAIATLAYAHLKEQLGAIGYRLSVDEERGILPDTTADVQKEHEVFEHFIVTGPAVPGVVMPSAMPGVIVEALFLSNDGDAQVLATDAGEAAIVTAYENAIVEYFERYPPALRPATATPVPAGTIPRR